ncbi:protein binding protein [Trifolium medium]|uniref:Protein binding protein n=1 Tax=Trifolium medium TaxID=97028 RepID=A0A392LYU7_9FABA|nr:protein binding protein [Trifolium medium]
MDHQHTLQLNGSAAASFTCSGCKELGFESSYICENSNCNYILHKECAEPVKHAVHPFFKNCNFEFIENSEKEGAGFCDGCGKDFSGFIYLSQKKGFFKRLLGFRYALHPSCLNMKENIMNDDGNVIMTLSDEVSMSQGIGGPLVSLSLPIVDP